MPKLTPFKTRPIQLDVEGILKEYFPELTGAQRISILWEYTGYPAFWNIPEDGQTPEECLRKQLMTFKKDNLL